jgi:hypothetical protein
MNAHGARDEAVAIAQTYAKEHNAVRLVREVIAASRYFANHREAIAAFEEQMLFELEGARQ